MDAKKIEEVPFEEVYEVEKYGTYYSENKFWQKVQRVAKKVGATVIRPVFQLYYLLHDKDVPLQHKAYIIGALGYFILPFDLIPEGLLPVIGFTDDVAVMGLVLKIVKDSITPEIRAKVMLRLWSCCKRIRSESQYFFFSYDQVHFPVERLGRNLIL